jgi:hypothetical protein
MGYQKDIWTHEGPSIQKKRIGHMKVQERKIKRKRKKDSHVLKRIYKGGEIIQRSFHPPFTVHYIHIRAHLDLIV